MDNQTIAVPGRQRLFSLFLYSSAGVLFISAAAKLISSFGNAEVLIEPDPIFAVSLRSVFQIAAAAELTVAFLCIVNFLKTNVRVVLVTCLATNFCIYRISLFLLHYHKPCGCLGSLTEAIHMPPKTADTLMKCILAYLLVGGYLILFYNWKRGPMTSSVNDTRQLVKKEK